MNRTELITGIQNGDREAFNDFCKEELPVLMSYARIFLPGETVGRDFGEGVSYEICL